MDNFVIFQARCAVNAGHEQRCCHEGENYNLQEYFRGKSSRAKYRSLPLFLHFSASLSHERDGLGRFSLSHECFLRGLKDLEGF